MGFKVKDLVIRLDAAGCGQTKEEDADNCTTTPPAENHKSRRGASRSLDLAALRSQLRCSLGAVQA